MAREQIDGVLDIKAGTIKDASVASDAAIDETKLLLDYGTADLNTRAVLIDADRTINNGVYVTVPSTGFKMVDAIDGKTYLFTLQNGVLKAEQV